MANKKISQLTPIANLNASNVIPLVSGASTYSSSLSVLDAFLEGYISSTGIYNDLRTSNLLVSGNANFASGINVTGNSTFNNNLVSLGVFNNQSGINVSGSSIFYSGLTVTGSNFQTNGTGFIRKITVGASHANNGADSSVVGGTNNIIVSSTQYGLIGGGDSNSISGSQNYNTILNGLQSYITDSDGSIIGAGNTSRISGSSSAMILGGANEIRSASLAVILNGAGNTISGGDYNTILNGGVNNISANGSYNTILGGFSNKIQSGVTLATIIGSQSIVNHGGAMILSDALNYTKNSPSSDSLSLFFRSGVYVSGSNLEVQGVSILKSGVLSSGSSTFQNLTVNQNGIFNSGITITGSNLRVNGTGYIDKIIGGIVNTAAGTLSSVAGGRNNSVIGNYSFIGGGSGNSTSSDYTTILGGIGNEISTSACDFSNIIGDGCLLQSSIHTNLIGAGHNLEEAPYCMILGNNNTVTFTDHCYLIGDNITSSVSYGVGLGRRISIDHSGAAVFGDGRTQTKSSLGENTCNFHYQNGVIISGGNLEVQGISVSKSGINASGNSIFQNVTVTGGFLTNAPLLQVFKSSKLDFKTTGTNNIFTIPAGYLYLIDTMEVLTTDIITAGQAPYVKFGNNTDVDAYQSGIQTLSNSLYARHLFQNPQDAIAAGIILNATILTASTAVGHSGFLLYKGFLIQNS